MILAVKLAGLAFGDFALPQLFIDPPVLVLQAVVDLGAPRVILLPLGLGRGAGHGDPGERDAQCNGGCFCCPAHGMSFRD